MPLSTPTIQMLFPDLICFDRSVDRPMTSAPIRYSNESAQKNAEVNQTCLDAVLDWISTLNLMDTPIVSSSPNLWEFLNGSVITLGSTRIIIIPHSEDHTEEFTIPQEWVDIPAWMGDYYLPIHLDPTTQQVCLLGYVSHLTLKQQGEFDAIYRTYELDRSHIITDLDLLWIAKNLALEERGIPTLTSSRQPSASQLEQLSQASRYSPRLDIGIEEWIAVITDQSLCAQLYCNRLANAARSPKTPLTAIITQTHSAITNLTQWLQRNFETSLQQGWQTIDSLFEPQSGSYNWVRSASTSDVITLAKLMNLQVQLETQSIILLIALTPNADQTVSLLTQVHPDSRMPYLPDRLKLTLQDGDTVLQSVISRSQDQLIQLRRFTCTSDTQFRITLELNGITVIEDFTIDDSRIDA